MSLFRQKHPTDRGGPSGKQERGREGEGEWESLVIDAKSSISLYTGAESNHRDFGVK